VTRRRRSVSAAAALGVLALAGVATYARVRPADPVVRRAAGMDLLLITVDTLRADALGCYGNPRAATPWMDRLAEQGVRFDEAQAHNVVTLPSHANILTGRLPVTHGVRDNAGFRLPAEVETLATVLRARGYRTGAFVSAFTLDSRFGLDRGFDVYDDAFASGQAAAAFELPERAGTETVAAARRWLDGADARPSFAWVHLYDPHAPYAPPPALAARFAAEPYLGDVAAADAALEPLLRPLLDRAGPEDAARTVVALTADHGESLGEHGERTHGIFAYEGTLRVPLILHAPRLLRPRVVEGRVQHVDLMPTLLDALAVPPPPGLPGRSLLAAAAGGRPAESAAYFEALSGQSTRGWAPLFGVVRGGLKYVDLPIPELYALEEDPREERNLAAARPQELERMRAALAALRAEDRPRDGARQESAETRERLQALGYLAAAAPASKRAYTAADDPKRLIELDAMLEGVLARHRAGDIGGALALCEEVVRRRPGMPSALLQLALLRRKSGRLGPAIHALEAAIAAAPDDEGTAALLGSYLNEAGRAREAEALLEPFADRPRPALDVLVARGIALSQLARHVEAEASLAAAVEADPSNAMTRVQLATVRLVARDLGGARAALVEALRLDARLAVAHRTLGVVAEAQGDHEQAQRSWRAAVEVDPFEHDALLRLGAALARAGRRAEARVYLERFVATAPGDVYGPSLASARAWLGRSASEVTRRSPSS
jgi:arylsulfatase A-like enzyme/Tfp pilus assembly protein PilF